eukprot:5558252-Amphidinium_carterae.2
MSLPLTGVCVGTRVDTMLLWYFIIAAGLFGAPCREEIRESRGLSLQTTGTGDRPMALLGTVKR